MSNASARSFLIYQQRSPAISLSRRASVNQLPLLKCEATDVGDNSDWRSSSSPHMVSLPTVSTPLSLCCGSCGEPADGEEGLRTHLMGDHLEWAPYKCSICPAIHVPTLQSLTAHHRQQHADAPSIVVLYRKNIKKEELLADMFEKSWRMSNSDASTKMYRSVDNLMLATVQPSPFLLATFSCCACEQTVGSDEDLRNHLMLEHLEEWTPYQCNICPGIRMTTVHSLTQHILQLHPARPLMITYRRNEEKETRFHEMMSHIYQSAFSCSSRGETSGTPLQRIRTDSVFAGHQSPPAVSVTALSTTTVPLCASTTDNQSTVLEDNVTPQRAPASPPIRLPRTRSSGGIRSSNRSRTPNRRQVDILLQLDQLRPLSHSPPSPEINPPNLESQLSPTSQSAVNTPTETDCNGDESSSQIEAAEALDSETTTTTDEVPDEDVKLVDEYGLIYPPSTMVDEKEVWLCSLCRHDSPWNKWSSVEKLREHQFQFHMASVRGKYRFTCPEKDCGFCCGDKRLCRKHYDKFGHKMTDRKAEMLEYMIVALRSKPILDDLRNVASKEPQSRCVVRLPQLKSIEVKGRTRFACGLCNRHFVETRAARNHQYGFHMSAVRKVHRYVCTNEECLFKTGTYDTQKQHSITSGHYVNDGVAQVAPLLQSVLESGPTADDLDVDVFRRYRAGRRASSARMPSQCTLCDKKLHSHGALQSHLYSLHMGIVRKVYRYVCSAEGCNFATGSIWRRKEHTNSNTGHTFRDRVDEVGPQLQDALKAGPIPEDATATVVQRKPTANKRLRLDPEMRTRCQLCTKQFSTPGGMLAHQYSVHMATIRRIYRYECSECRYKCAERNGCQSHRTKTGHRITDNTPAVQTELEIALNAPPLPQDLAARHNSVRHGVNWAKLHLKSPKNCLLCGITLKRKWSKNAEHYYGVHLGDVRGIYRYVCKAPECGEKSGRSQWAHNHRAKHEVDDRQFVVLSDLKEMLRDGPIAGDATAAYRAVKKAQRIRQQERQQRVEKTARNNCCVLCSTNFVDKRPHISLRRHYYAYHLGEVRKVYRYRCREHDCDLQTGSYDKQRTHSRTTSHVVDDRVSEIEDDFKRMLHDPQPLDTDFRKMGGETTLLKSVGAGLMQNETVCKLCQTEFHTATTCRNHYFAVHLARVRQVYRYTCETEGCNDRSGTRDWYRQHRLQGHVVKDRLSEIMEDVRRMFAEELLPADLTWKQDTCARRRSTTTTADRTPVVKTEPQQHICRLCSKVFDQLGLMIKHYYAFHLAIVRNKFRYVCTVCGKGSGDYDWKRSHGKVVGHVVLDRKEDIQPSFDEMLSSGAISDDTELLHLDRDVPPSRTKTPRVNKRKSAPAAKVTRYDVDSGINPILQLVKMENEESEMNTKL